MKNIIHLTSKYGYRNGVGKPEGIVVHDTANDNSTIEGEINYMRNNYTNAFVHAFVDDEIVLLKLPLLIIYLGELDHMEIIVLLMLKLSIHMIMLHLHVQ